MRATKGIPRTYVRTYGRTTPALRLGTSVPRQKTHRKELFYSLSLEHCSRARIPHAYRQLLPSRSPSTSASNEGEVMSRLLLLKREVLSRSQCLSAESVNSCFLSRFVCSNNTVSVSQLLELLASQQGRECLSLYNAHLQNLSRSPHTEHELLYYNR